MTSIIKKIMEYNGIKLFISHKHMAKNPKIFNKSNLFLNLCLSCEKMNYHAASYQVWDYYLFPPQEAEYLTLFNLMNINKIKKMPAKIHYKDKNITESKFLFMGDLICKLGQIGDNCDRYV